MFKLPGLTHELLHYLPAWYWNLNPRINSDWSRMRHHRTTDGRNMVILLMPAFVGLLAFPALWYVITHKIIFHIAASIFWVGWMGACGSDLYAAGYFILFHKWHDRKDNND